MPSFAYLLIILAHFLNWGDPAGQYAVYCNADQTMCQIENDNGGDYATTIARAYPVECVNGRWMQVNRTGYPSHSEQVFDVGPWNPGSTSWNDCGQRRLPRW